MTLNPREENQAREYLLCNKWPWMLTARVREFATPVFAQIDYSRDVRNDLYKTIDTLKQQNLELSREHESLIGKFNDQLEVTRRLQARVADLQEYAGNLEKRNWQLSARVDALHDAIKQFNDALYEAPLVNHPAPVRPNAPE